MKRTVDEKLNYNKKKLTMFSTGYVVGVTNYRNYPKSNIEGKRKIDEIIRQAKAGVKDPTATKEMQDLYKGILSGCRDAANERKKHNS